MTTRPPKPPASAAASGFDQAVRLYRQGELPAAQAHCERLLERDPRHASALHLLGVIAAQRGDWAHAVDCLDRAITLKPGDAHAHLNRGMALLALARPDAALADFDRAIALDPRFAEAHFNRGNALAQLQRIELAIVGFDQALALQPNFAAAHRHRGNALGQLERYAAALASFERALALQPDDVDAHVERANALKLLGRLDDAIAGFDRALALRPGRVDALRNRANALQALGRFDAAIASFDGALELRPDDVEARFGRATALLWSGRIEPGLAACAAVIERAPEHAEAHFIQALFRLLTGRLREGFAQYEWRTRVAAFRRHQRAFAQPRWLGPESLVGQTVLVHAEQGLGDTIQFCRYAPLLVERGARVLFEAPAPLLGLLGRLDARVAMMASGSPLPPFDVHCPLLSLPLAFGTELASIPARTSYLSADAAKLAQWSQRLGPRRRPRIGLAWSGNPQHPNDRTRSLPLAQLLAVLAGEIELVSLQPEVRASDRAALDGAPTLRHFGAELRDFDDTAALCRLMDVVISVDTSVAHLSAALGQRTWVLLAHVPDWRWLLGRRDSPWYPSVTLYRQAALDDWDSALSALRGDLSGFAPTAPPS